MIEPFTHYAPTGEGWAEGLEGCGWSVERRQKWDVSGSSELVVIADTPGSPLAEPLLLDALDGSVKIVAIVSDAPNFDIARTADSVDLFVSHTIRHDALDAAFAAAGAKLLHLPLAGRRMFADLPPAVPVFDVCFVGSYWHGNRGGREFVAPFLGNGTTACIAGCEGKPPVPYRNLPGLYVSSKVGLNFHYPYQKSASQVELNARTFDLALAGCFEVCDNPAVKELLPGVAVADADSWVETVRHYLEEPTLRAKMAEQAREVAIREHTWGARMRQFLEMAGLS